MNTFIRMSRSVPASALITLALLGCASTEPTAPPNTPRAISGKVTATPQGNASIGVVLTLDGSRTTTTDDSSRYRFDSVAVGDHEVRPSKTGSTFSPSSRAVKISDADVTNVDFAQTSTAIPADSVHLVRIPAGTFMMGCDGTFLCFPVAQPRHKVTLTRSFMIGSTETTQAVWQRVMPVNDSKVVGSRFPVTNVSFDSITTFCNRLSVLHGLRPVYSGYGKNTIIDKSANGYRLPTQAEWEYAARAGSTSAISGVPDPAPGADLELYYQEVDKVAWYRGVNQGASGPNAQPVAQLKPNAWGLYDVHGNVCERVEGESYLYTADESIDPDFLPYRFQNVIKGGSNGIDNAVYDQVTVWHRLTVTFKDQASNIGFRIARYE
ncbi:MAG: SUMF1/EgtB/PvdO family nonheme iron enzyme [Ignavibacteria bacterium]|nr:SUMF1/EgtB/PvdO family nonheme iron enzyme [Ignavibacteria bacterium]MBK7034418.1 SUMF1/EgtB/PvdO family nonheme iron enzyme [Ignavibacteria bacterium]MBK7578503.1 SUMF1/EgtB/PvdO family nonheme iron enzyme [Ignavibacteria bacterium]MBK9182078.1 SUMF1/EgtB/PvdO family nonheme iron enzyme [Ignavibacteria bacterium]